ncbi:MAG: glutamate-5-semialdehyde dehydrogenase, partial [Actinomycetota bacterium]|nr:glutamate-5-semialdehyde dehydrogenase [Actinomycetota bacterium]
TELRRVVTEAAQRAGRGRGTDALVHQVVGSELDRLGEEWEWEDSPEYWLVEVESVAEAVGLFNRRSPRLAASLISEDANEHDRFYAAVDAPFVGNGFTRWVDGQFALNQPELGLSNWQSGRLFGRGGVLSGDSVYTVRLRAEVRDHSVHR